MPARTEQDDRRREEDGEDREDDTETQKRDAVRTVSNKKDRKKSFLTRVKKTGDEIKGRVNKKKRGK